MRQTVKQYAEHMLRNGPRVPFRRAVDVSRHDGLLGHAGKPEANELVTVDLHFEIERVGRSQRFVAFRRYREQRILDAVGDWDVEPV